MAIRFKLEERFRAHGAGHRPGTLYRYFEPYFQYLLKAEHGDSSNTDFYETYVPDDRVAGKLGDFLKSSTDSVLTITGPRGIGKSTHLRYHMGLKVDAHFDVTKNSLFVPIYIDNFMQKYGAQTATKAISDAVGAACYTLEKETGIVAKNAELIEFIEHNKTSVLTGISQDLTPETINGAAQSLLNELSKNHPIKYNILLLKFLLIKTKVERIVIICDDMESADFEFQSRAMLEMLSLRICLQNTGDYGKNYVVGNCFCMRPATFKHIRDHSSQIDGYIKGSTFPILAPVPLSAIVQKRFDFAISRIGTGTKNIAFDKILTVDNKEKWTQSFFVLENIIQKIDTKYNQYIAAFANYDVRDSLTILERALENSHLFEVARGDDLPGAFTVEESRYHLSDANVLQAILIEDSIPRALREPILANVIRNEPHPQSDLIVAYILRYFKNNYAGSYVEITKRRLRDILLIAFRQPQIDAYYLDSLDYLSSMKCIRIEKNGEGEDALISQPRALVSYRCLKDISVPLEFMRDSTYAYHRRYEHFYGSGAAIPTYRMIAESRFEAVLDLISEIIESEAHIYGRLRKLGRASSERRIFLEAFGETSVSETLIEGVGVSYRAYFKGSAQEIGRRLASIRVDIKDRLRLHA